MKIDRVLAGEADLDALSMQYQGNLDATLTFLDLNAPLIVSFSGVVCTSSSGQMARVHATVDIALSEVP